MEVIANSTRLSPSLSWKVLLQPKIVLAVWFVGFWFILIGIRHVLETATKSSGYTWAYWSFGGLIGVTYAQHFAIITLIIFSRQSVVGVVGMAGIIGIGLTMVVSRAAFPERMTETWPSVLIELFVYSVICVLSRRSIARHESRWMVRPARLSVADLLFAVSIFAVFFALTRSDGLRLWEAHQLDVGGAFMYPYHFATSMIHGVIQSLLCLLWLKRIVEWKPGFRPWLAPIFGSIFAFALSVLVSFAFAVVFAGYWISWSSVLEISRTIPPLIAALTTWFAASMLLFRSIGLLPPPRIVQLT